MKPLPPRLRLLKPLRLLLLMPPLPRPPKLLRLLPKRPRLLRRLLRRTKVHVTFALAVHGQRNMKPGRSTPVRASCFLHLNARMESR